MIIHLSAGLVVRVDRADYAQLSRFKWSAHWSGSQWYARRAVRIHGRDHKIYMHRVIAGARRGQFVDHADQDSLNNRRRNLRRCLKKQNAHNKSRTGRKVYPYKGLTYHPDSRRTKRWGAKIRAGSTGKDGRAASIFLGWFASATEAAVAYDAAARRYFGEFAAVNFPGR